MTKKEKAILIESMLEEIYPSTSIPLTHKNPFTLLIAVLLSAQCTDERVNKITPQLFALADNPEAMAKLSVEDIKSIIRPCGLANNKSKNIKKLSEILVAEYDGQVPNTFAQLESLPGVGHKTASVVMAQAFAQSAFPVDTHIHRLAKRWGLSSGKNVKETERDLKKLFPEEKWADLHLRIIYYGREYSPARGFDINKSPIDLALAGKT